MNLPPLHARVSLRREGSDGARDVVGDVVALDEDAVTLLPWDRGPERVPASEIAVWRRVPPKAVRPSSTPADLARLSGRGWPGLETVRLGGWELRAGGGYTSRANSALPEGEPGIPVDAAIDAVAGFYADRDLVPTFQLSARRGEQHPLARPLTERGWSASKPTVVMVTDLRSATHAAAPRAHWREVPDAAWLRAQGGRHALQSAVLTAAPALFLTVDGERTGHPSAIARLAPTADWVGISCVWVDPEQRGRGLGRAVMAACAQRGLELGARFGYLQVEQGNDRARGLYQSLGWTEHHDYEYWSPR